ncbi:MULTISPECIES: lytic transglycosylase domain-containing protein [Ralstonia]|jgi:soluble lytic murein transglycosylase-like protein|uniref:Transglycosylase SLT domain-containing protein n=3 Tax=Ralstonia TaxID=48736 RepID=A0AAD2BQ12_9RALS|nr:MULTISPECIES: lytic transglycosylase domain-containing protein [Ralstonia]MBE3032844.1 lytic transglycosylase domain-containing protein [Actinomycetota bacterium]MEA3268109.1 lytic transglycosylase domain-containing protein [Pseudomonadota bacterium]ENZ78409.1 soluble lytic murein transglycosylase-like protein [Ralstonia pickettii OR214]MBB0025248.1 lytic transglycosylase domain-containing protein [Ralstonia pickettii]MBB0036036.1 lytic transglycosylase domain-containing protein [Ralstonia 
MNGWKTLHSSGIGSALQRRLVAPVGRRLARAGQVALPRKLRMELNAGGAAASRNELHPGVLLVFRSGHVVLNSIGLLAVAAAVALSLNSEWRATVAQRVLHFTPGVDTSVASANPSPAIAAGVQPVAFAPTAPSAGTGAAQAVAPAAAQGGTVAAAGWDTLSKVPSVAELAAQIPNTQVVRDARESATAGTPREQAAVAEYIARKYRVAATATGQLVKAAYQTGKEVGLDPLLILGVMAIESSFNPFAESGMGAQGLMQVMTKVHQDKYEVMGGVGAALNPYANIKVGALVLKDCIARAGSIEGGLKLYVGAVTQGDGGYGGKVLQERSRLRMVATGHRSPMTVASEREPVKPVATATPVTQADAKTQATKPSDKQPAAGQQEEARLDNKSQGQA